MDTQIVAIYCICDDILKGLHHVEDKQRKMSDAEVLTTSIVAALFSGGNMERSRNLLARARVYSSDVGEKPVQPSPTSDGWFVPGRVQPAGRSLETSELRKCVPRG